MYLTAHRTHPSTAAVAAASAAQSSSASNDVVAPPGPHAQRAGPGRRAEAGAVVFLGVRDEAPAESSRRKRKNQPPTLQAPAAPAAAVEALSTAVGRRLEYCFEVNQRSCWFSGQVIHDAGGHWADVLFDDGDKHCVKLLPSAVGTAWRWLLPNGAGLKPIDATKSRKRRCEQAVAAAAAVTNHGSGQAAAAAAAVVTKSWKRPRREQAAAAAAVTNDGSTWEFEGGGKPFAALNGTELAAILAALGGQEVRRKRGDLTGQKTMESRRVALEKEVRKKYRGMDAAEKRGERTGATAAAAVVDAASSEASSCVDDDGTLTPMPVLRIGESVDALGSDRMWCKARIVKVGQAIDEVKVHFVGFAARFDEWIATPGGESPRLAALGTMTSGKAAASDGKMVAASAASAAVEGPQYVGVQQSNGEHKWTAEINLHGNDKLRLGGFDDEHEAARAFDVAARRLRGDDAHGGRGKHFGKRWRLNFPTPKEVHRARELGALLTDEDKAAAAALSERQGPSKYVGVSWDKLNRKWGARVQTSAPPQGGRRKSQYLGRFDDEQEAAHAVDIVARELRGDDAHGGRGSRNSVPWQLNFPTSREVQRARELGALITQEEKAAAVVAAERQGPSDYVGVSWDKVNRKWAAAIGGKKANTNRTEYGHLGRFDDEQDAARAVDTAARQLRGDSAHGGKHTGNGQWLRLNFPTEREAKRAKALGMPARYSAGGYKTQWPGPVPPTEAEMQQWGKGELRRQCRLLELGDSGGLEQMRSRLVLYYEAADSDAAPR